jgi:hypothetical protein
MAATRAAGSMLISPQASDVGLFCAAALVHCTISLFWAAILVWLLPRRRIMTESLVAAAFIAVLDLRIIARLFPEVYSLPFWPQFADHLAWGVCFGLALRWTQARDPVLLTTS